MAGTTMASSAYMVLAHFAMRLATATSIAISSLCSDIPVFQERINSWVIFQVQRRVTRFQIREITDMFPFLLLPAEIRIMIYLLYLNFNGVGKYFDHHFNTIPKPVTKGMPLRAPTVSRGTPSILLLNKQITAEVKDLYRKMTIHFNHGMLQVRRITSVVSRHVLVSVAHIEISDDGHPMLQEGTISPSWYGYMRLIDQLSAILKYRHRLRSLTIRFTDESLHEHTHECDGYRYSCGFRDGMYAAMTSMTKIRNVPKVTLIGFPPVKAEELVRLMQLPIGNTTHDPKSQTPLEPITPQLTKFPRTDLEEDWVDYEPDAMDE